MKAITVVAVLLLALVGSVQAATLIVAPSGSPYTSIQNAVNQVVSGDTILIEPGRYIESVTISTAVTLRGAGTTETFLVPLAGGPAFTISEAGVQIEGLTLQGEGTGTGIYASADTISFRAIAITGWETGLLLQNSQGSRIADCTIQDNSRSGVILLGSTSTTITRTTLRNNGERGLYIDSASSGNTFYLNNFENEQNVVGEGSGNAWNSPGMVSYTFRGLTYQSVLGNYWSDHPAGDMNADGILDSPYLIEPAKGRGSFKNPKIGETDLYPLATPWEELFPALRPTPVLTTPVTIPTTLTPVDTLTTLPPVSTTTVPGEEGKITPTRRSEIPVFYLLPFGILLGIVIGGWFLMNRRNSRSTERDGRERSGSIYPSTVSADTLLSREVSYPQNADLGEPHFPLELVERYSQIAYAGKGGIARVFRAQRKSDGRTVAVKIPVSFDAETGKAFMNEMQVWKDLHHPNIVEVTEVNILPLPYVEMEYFDRSLDHCTTPLEISTAVRIVRGIAEGLSYAHRKGVIHRDLKPHNILLAKDLTPKIADWGLSRVLSQDTTGMTGFSLPYASPEQLSPRQFGSTGPWTDIYQLGVIMYELLFGTPPFEGEGMYEMGTAIISAPPVPPQEAQPRVASILPVVLRCLEKEPSRRYQSAEEFLADLEAHLQDIGKVPH